ncbi:hypothetical protein NDU88_006202 [Pleurodeles waltl]|uniref:Uncharacterized protein n=1 Tax=Pleurodeles waltl TaxID=8319 RepID=A0AAV7QI19_PLEWA|nr:hypothetical protein NDU88_006202 [Pleurodeles waltl]
MTFIASAQHKGVSTVLDPFFEVDYVLEVIGGVGLVHFETVCRCYFPRVLAEYVAAGGFVDLQCIDVEMYDGVVNPCEW